MLECVPLHGFIFQLRGFANLLSAANSSVFRFLFLASQASDLGSIPIARSIKPVDAVGFTGFPPLKMTSNCSILDAVGREIAPETEFWTRRKRMFC
jgi:hypothetical protein